MDAKTEACVDVKKYQAMVSSPMYAMLCTPLYLAYTIQQLSQFNSNLMNAHFQGAKQLFWYLQATQTTNLIYGNYGNRNITNVTQG